MDMGQPSDEGAILAALIAAAAPDPVPAEQAMSLLQRVGEKDAAVLGRLAYHALTGVAPGDGEPEAPGAVVPGFPPFAAEVLMRAIVGPDHRRPTAQALLIVLDTVPAASWPSAGRPFITLPPTAATSTDAPSVARQYDEQVAEQVHEHVDEQVDAVPAPAEPETVETSAVPEAAEVVEPAEESVDEPAAAQPVAATDPVSSPEPEPEFEVDEAEDLQPTPVAEPTPVAGSATSRRIRHDEFRSLLTPSREVPRFDPLSDPLTDPWAPEQETSRSPAALFGISAPAPLDEHTGSDRPEEPDETEGLAPTAEAEPGAEPQPVDIETDTTPGVSADTTVEPDPHTTWDDACGMHDEFRDFASPTSASGTEPAATLAVATPPEEPAHEEQSASRRSRRKRTERKQGKEQARTEHKQSKEQARTERKERKEQARRPRAPGTQTAEGDRHQTLLLVALLLVLVVLGVVYAASRDSAEPGDPGNESPQGASRSMVQPVDVRV